MSRYKKAAVIGVGLIGGSVGLALREKQLASEVVGIGRRQASLDLAKQVGAIDRGTTDLAQGVQQADLVIVCTPVEQVAAKVLEVAKSSDSEMLITDAGSTKGQIVSLVNETLGMSNSEAKFVGSHPLAGDHRSGPEHARADLFVDRQVVVTPTEETSPEAVEQITQFWESLGARVTQMSPDAHDQALAVTSHLPHLIASALASGTPIELLPLASTGWQDTTRIAAGDAQLWHDIFNSNRSAVLAALDDFEQVLANYRQALADEHSDQLQHLLQEAKETRDALGS